jgi:CRISPR/Cas system-associated exonuclease Cas4 (RecB family)
MAEIFDLLARVSWETNGAEIEKLNSELKKQDRTLDELRQKGKRLEDQLARTNDPKKQAALTAELKKTQQAQDNIVKSQKQQVEVQKQLAQKAKELAEEMRKTNDPAKARALVQELRKVENQLDAMSVKAKNAGGALQGMGARLGGIGEGILGGLGLGAGMFGAQALTSGIVSFVGDAIAEIEQAEKATRDLNIALRATGNEKYLQGLINEASQLAEEYRNVYDNDEIVSAQTELVKYGKFTRAELKDLTKVAIELASSYGETVPQAANRLIDVLAGRGRQTLTDFGLSTKMAGTDSERLSLVLGELSEKLNGTTDAFANSATGIKKQNEILLADVKEKIGEKILPIYIDTLNLINQVLEGKWQDIGKKFLEGMNNISKYTNFVGIGTEVTKKVWGNILGTDDPEVKKGVSDEIRNFFKAQYAAAAEAQKTEGKKINNAKTAEEIEAEKERQQELEKKRKEAAEKAAAERKAAEEKEKQEQERNWQAYLAAQKQFEDEKAKATMSAMDYELLKLKDHFDAIRAAYKKVGKDVTAINALENTERAKIIEKSREVDRKFLKQSEDARKQEEKAKKEGIKNEADALVERTKAAVAQRIADNKARQERKQTEEEQARTDREKLYNEIINATEVAQSILDIEKQKTDRLIELQQQRVDAAKDNSKVSLKIEEDRLNALLERRQKYERAQRAIDAAVIVANQAVAISGAIRAITDAGGNPVLIAANAIAIAASIAAAIAAVRSGFGDVGFKEGGYTGDGDPNQESTAVGRRPYKYHKGEFVMDADLTADHRDLFEGIHKRRLKVRQLDDGQYYIAPDVDKLSADYQTAKYSTQDGQVLAELSAMRRLMQQREVSVTNNFDADGFGQAVASQMGQIHLKNLRRN